MATLLKATTVPIEYNSGETIEQLRDMAANWQFLRRIRNSPSCAAGKDLSLDAIVNVPDISLYGVDVSFPALKDDAETEYLDNLPTSFVLPTKRSIG